MQIELKKEKKEEEKEKETKTGGVLLDSACGCCKNWVPTLTYRIMDPALIIDPGVKLPKNMIATLCK